MLVILPKHHEKRMGDEIIKIRDRETLSALLHLDSPDMIMGPPLGSFDFLFGVTPNKFMNK